MKPKTNELSVLMAVLALFPAVSFADNRAGGEGTTTNVTIGNTCDENTDIWNILESEILTTTTASNCIVTACSDIGNNSVNTDNAYNFAISLDDTSPGLNTVSERSLEINNNANVNDPSVWPVCSTRFLPAVTAGTHTIYWLACKQNALSPNQVANDTTMTIGCFNGSEL
ncbi:MAG: hypothetical protein ACHBNF_14760 [Chromatiales bacterium]